MLRYARNTLYYLSVHFLCVVWNSSWCIYFPVHSLSCAYCVMLVGCKGSVIFYCGKCLPLQLCGIWKLGREVQSGRISNKFTASSWWQVMCINTKLLSKRLEIGMHKWTCLPLLLNIRNLDTWWNVWYSVWLDMLAGFTFLHRFLGQC